MGKLKFTLVLLMAAIALSEAQFQIGLGRSDVTGPSVEVSFMGYAVLEQRGHGIQTRQFSRAFIVQDTAGQRIVYVVAEVGMISHPMRKDVIAQLQQSFGGIYSVNNVMLSATHTHSGPGGYHHYVLYDFTCLGFISETYHAIVNGIVQSIVNAHNSMFQGRMFVTETTVHGVSINRSPYAYDNNPAAEIARYGSREDRTMQHVRFINSQNEIVGSLSWMATHATSMNNSNQFISSDNLGVAALLLEQEYNRGQLPGHGTFIGAFATAHSADISPNINGPRCVLTGHACAPLTSECPTVRGDVCIASGPGRTHRESTKIIGTRIYDAASRLLRSGGGRELVGRVGFIHQYVHMPSQTGSYFNPKTNQWEFYRGCLPAMGFSFGAGTTDGPGAFDFTQGTTSGNPFWNAVRNFLAKPTADDKACHAPKPILLMTGRTTRPYQWQPPIVPTQIITIGDLVVLGLPGEFTTMSGRRLRSEITALGTQRGRNLIVVPAGLTNIYSSYVVTPEEYQVQRYEGASTAFGPHTLTIYISQFNQLYTALMNGKKIGPGPSPLNESNYQMTFLTPVINDGSNVAFGHVLVQPRPTYHRNQEVFVAFEAGNPRNNLNTGSTFFSVEMLVGTTWTTIATDANLETRFRWRRTSTILGRSEIDFFWEIPTHVAHGRYRIRHNGHSRGPLTGVRAYVGISHEFTIQ